jgi:CxxC motif-containing protein
MGLKDRNRVENSIKSITYNNRDRGMSYRNRRLKDSNRVWHRRIALKDSNRVGE